jgi:hypothetical protein
MGGKGEVRSGIEGRRVETTTTTLVGHTGLTSKEL